MAADGGPPGQGPALRVQLVAPTGVAGEAGKASHQPAPLSRFRHPPAGKPRGMTMWEARAMISGRTFHGWSGARELDSTGPKARDRSRQIRLMSFYYNKQ